MKLRLTPKQMMWANIFSCAVERSLQYQGTDRHEREHTTVVLALQKGKQFWKELL
jgi:hypothetical protein